MRRFAILAVTLVLLVPTPAGAGDREVAVDDNFYQPGTVRPRVGDSVHWTRAPGSDNAHDVEEDSRLFDSGAPTTGAIDFTIIFSAGTFHYFCVVHGNESGGMDGLVRVRPTINSSPPGLPFTVRWANSNTQTGTVFDVKFRVGGGSWQRWYSNTSRFRGVFGDGGRPVSVSNGVQYSFKVRSQRGSADSRWSPVESFSP